MGPEPIEIPDHFTVAWYTQQKEQRRNDDSIAAELLISKALLQKWKKRIGYVSFSGNNIAGRKSIVDIKLLMEMREQGAKRKDIAETFGVCILNVDYHLRKLGMTRKRA